MYHLRTLRLFLGLLMAAMLLVGCGGGGETSVSQAPPSGSTALLSWTPPETTVDNTAIDPLRELDYYELYIREDENFTELDLPVAQVAAVEDLRSADGLTVTRALVEEFDLDLLPGLPASTQLYVSLRAVGTDSQRSVFMAPVAWTRS